MTIKEVLTQVENYNKAIQSLNLNEREIRVTFLYNDLTEGYFKRFVDLEEYIKNEFVMEVAEDMLKVDLNDKLTYFGNLDTFENMKIEFEIWGCY